MSLVLPSRFYGDPADVCDELKRLREYEAELKERERVRKARRIRKLTKLAKARELRGQR